MSSAGSGTETSPLQTTGLVLAGGRSSRFGSDKLAARIDGVSILARAVAAVGSVSEDVIVVLPPAGPEPELPSDPAHRFVRDTDAFLGPLAGVAVGLAAARADLVAVVAGDMPFVAPRVLAELVRVAAEAPVEAAALVEGDRVRPMPCVLRRDCALEVARVLLGTGERRLRALLDGLRVAAIAEATWTALDPARRTLVDVDEPGDLPR
jgi:molybdopterin-guanine dinucleotide biosynthesis protein A